MKKREEGEPERKTQQKNIKRKTKQNKIFKASIIIIIMVLLLLLMLNIIVFYKHLHIINALLYTSSLTFVQGHRCT